MVRGAIPALAPPVQFSKEDPTSRRIIHLCPKSPDHWCSSFHERMKWKKKNRHIFLSCKKKSHNRYTIYLKNALFRDPYQNSKWNLKLSKRSFHARHPVKTASYSCENEAFLHVFLQKLQVEVVKTNFLRETSLKDCTLKTWKRSFRARHPSKTASWSCENRAFMQEVVQILQVAVAKTIDCCCNDCLVQSLSCVHNTELKNTSFDESLWILNLKSLVGFAQLAGS